MKPTIVKVNLTGDGLANLKGHIRDNLTRIKRGLTELHTVKLPEWRRIYEGRPLEQHRTVPFENASNLVVQLVAIHADTLKARLMTALTKTKPAWVAKVAGEWQGEAAPLREALEEFMGTEAFEPDSWDLYRVYDECMSDVVQYGTTFIGTPWVKLHHDLVVPAGDGSGAFDYVPETYYEGSRPEKIAFEDFFMSPSDKRLETSNFKARLLRLYKHELEERAFDDIYDKEVVKTILSNPDRTGQSPAQTQNEQDAGIRSPQPTPVWDIYECWFYYLDDDGHKTKIVASYHLATETLLRATYTFLPDDPFVGARLLYWDGHFHGRGLCWFLGTFQEELSQIHNDRRNAQTVANAKVWRVDPYSKLHEGFKIYPSAVVPAVKDEIEPMSHGEPSQVEIEEERLTLELSERRSGISQAMQAYGAGSFNKRGVYSSMGTLSVLQEGNNRTDMIVGDIRYFHTKVGRLLSRQLAALGLDQRERFDKYGVKANNIIKALDAMLKGKMLFPLQAPTASINREVEKQSDTMLVALMSRHYQAVAAFLAQGANPQMPPEVKAYMASAVQAMNKLMTVVMKHFDYDDPEIYVPEVQGGGSSQSVASQQTGNAGLAIPSASGQLPGMGGGGAETQPAGTGVVQ